MFLKREVRGKDGKEHVYYYLAESTRVGRNRVVQRRLLNLGELNTTQIDRWQRSIEVIEEDGRACQRRLFSDREGQAPRREEDVCEVVLSSLSVRRPRILGDCWLGCRLWGELGLDKFWFAALGDRRGAVEWSKVMELLAVNRLCAPGSELSIHERWFARTAMDFLLGCDEMVAGKDRLYRALDKALEHRDALMGHLQERWSELFGVECQILLYDLTSTYFEGEAAGVPAAARGYSRDHRPDTLQVIVALVVTAEGFPVAYEVFDGDTADVSTLEEIVSKIESKYGMKGRVWVFDRGVVSEDNLQELRERGAYYLVGTPRRKLADFERELLTGDWQEIAGNPGVRVQLLSQGTETFVLARSLQAGQEGVGHARKSARAFAPLAARPEPRGGPRRTQGRRQNRAPAWPARRALSPRLVHAQRGGTSKGPALMVLEQGASARSQAASGRLSLAHQSRSHGPRRSLASIRAAHRSRSRLSGSQERTGHPSHLAPHPAPRRGSYLSGLSGLLLVGLSQAKAQSSGPIHHPGPRLGEPSLYPDGRGLVQSSPWRPTLPAPDHRT